MKLSMLTFSMMGEEKAGAVDAKLLCRIAKENGIAQIDLLKPEIDLLGEEKLIAAMRDAGVSCGCLVIGASFFHAPKNVKTELESGFSQAQRLGTDTVMIIPGGVEDQPVCASMTREQLLDRAAEMYALAVALGKQQHLRVCFENTPQAWKPLSSAADCLEILNRVPGLGFVFDTANFRVADTQCDELAAYEMLKSRITRVHLKDVALGNFGRGEKCVDGQWIMPVTLGSGVIPMEKLLQRFCRDGFDGSFVLEYSAQEAIHGEDHIAWVKPYADFARNAFAGTRMHLPCGTIPGIDKPVSRLFFGTAIGPMLTGQNADALLDAALALGINAFDCARGYGLAEKVLGDWMRRRNNRDRVVVLTKCGNVNGRGEVKVNRQVIERELSESLEALGTEYIDIYLLHRDDPATPISEIMDYLNDMKRQGKIRVFGASNWTHERIAEANQYAVENGLEGFAVSSPNYGLARQMQDPWGGECVTISGPENVEARTWYAENQMPVIAYSSLGRGFFSGRFRSDDPDGAKKVLDVPAQKGYLYPENMERLRRAEQMAERDGTSVSQIALRYVFAGPMNMYAIVSTTNPDRLRENVEAACHPLSRTDAAELEGTL